MLTTLYIKAYESFLHNKDVYTHKCCNLPCLVTSDLTDFYKQVLNAFFASRSKTAKETSFQNEIL